MLIPGLVSVTFKDLDAENIIELASSNGLQAVEWSENWHIKEGDCKKARQLADLCARKGIIIAALGSYYRLGSSSDFSTRLSVAQAMGTSVIKIWAGEKPSSEVGKDELAQLVKEARDLALEAEPLGITIALEWHKNTLTDTNESAFEFLTLVDRPNFKALWQPTAALSLEEREQGLLGLGKRLVNLHVYHWDASGRRPLEEGVGEWGRYFSLVDPSENHYALLEFVKDNSRQQFEEDAAVLLGLVAGTLSNKRQGEHYGRPTC